MDVEKIVGRWAQPASTARQQHTAAGPISTKVKSSVYDYRQFELDALERSKPVKTDESICSTLRATEGQRSTELLHWERTGDG